MNKLDGLDIALLTKLRDIKYLSLEKQLFPCTLITRLTEIFQDWDEIILERAWNNLQEKGLVKDIPLRVYGSYGGLIYATDFLTNKGIEMIY